MVSKIVQVKRRQNYLLNAPRVGLEYTTLF